MNTTIKLGVAGALAFGAVAAHASIANPSNGSSDAILFAEVLNATQTSVVASYAGDTGVSVNTLIAGLTGSTTVLGGDANLHNLFTADAAGDVIEWSVQGGQYNGGNGANAPAFSVTGAAQFITTTTGSSTSNLVQKNTGNLTHWAGLSNDVSTINVNSGGANSVEGPSAANAGVWDYPTPGGTSGWYKNGPGTGNLYDGTTAQNLYYITGGGSTGAKVLSTVEGTATLTANGLVLAGVGGTTPPPAVPLPAAVWLLGSGLLGLTGVARRKLKV
jgi:hypothetical protein